MLVEIITVLAICVVAFFPTILAFVQKNPEKFTVLALNGILMGTVSIYSASVYTVWIFWVSYMLLVVEQDNL